MKICPVGAALIHADRHDEFISRFSLYMRTRLIVSCLYTYTSPCSETAALSTTSLHVFLFIFPHSAIANFLQIALIYISYLKRV
jgi:hypothetical protein